MLGLLTDTWMLKNVASLLVVRIQMQNERNTGALLI